MSTIMSCIGIAVLVFIGYLFSENKRQIKFKTIAGALTLQILLGAFVMFVPAGVTIIEAMSSGVNSVIAFSNSGLTFVFGDLANYKLGFVFVINVLCVVIFISALISVLYYLKVMQFIINIIGGGLSKILGTSKAESLSATANIFVGPIEAPSMVRPLVKNMTRSELFAVMTGGLASVAGGTMVGYINLGIDPKYILTACFMTAPAGLLFAKLLCPQTEQNIVNNDNKIEDADQPKGLLAAITDGSLMGMNQVITVTALLVSFVAIIALLNGIIGSIGNLFSIDKLTLEMIIGYLLSPLAFLMGVPWSEAIPAASIIGQKIAINEFVAYISFLEVSNTLSDKTQAIVVFSLCGFANIGSLAMVVGGIAAMCPDKRELITQIGPRVLLAAILANLMSGTIAGALVSLM
ncbi:MULTISPECIES: NupC/NupG family nucleoside CNT transporter [Shewanella]|uniref:NupC/NupG family nucleoside CNT transporter n=1 Tax=Shewanella xiamenensis TaxID=332186 RepID=A0ABT6UHR9_9GAMM|nr:MULTISPECIES: NupC/NupG family nucleoside CNT transporter [Shewanella]MBW0279332.1 NupC/NupG family nucleoside CNT transporter [Shewanella xiamenensis]MBW0296048.1 NupC/NupG family nucleoside CNT transporter [Shewanella xiamenensis]MCH7422269.1 NupC/NupG family nucleoside CNT transporter [Shewanella sp. MM_2022_3]MCL1071653.1 NupC/NupG family nucleoside CNT transporter [Shewanella xiamenensis]MCR4533995.1 NupC/NupG family nucleoside CNT transporter [Shewanella xiamenensis]